jgi:predicted metal-dependent hydrolase
VIEILRRAHASPMNFELGEALRHGGRLFNAGKYYEAHEAWEDVWRPMHGAERDFFRGLIQLAVAMKKAREANPAGVARLLERVDGLLEPYEPVHREVDVAGVRTTVAALRREAAEWLAGRASALTTEPPRLPD